MNERSNSAFDDLAEVMKSEKIDFVQLPYNIINTEAEQHILPLAQDKGIGVIPNRPFQQGRLFRAVKGNEVPLWAADFDCKSWAQFFCGRESTAKAPMTCRKRSR